MEALKELKNRYVRVRVELLGLLDIVGYTFKEEIKRDVRGEDIYINRDNEYLMLGIMIHDIKQGIRKVRFLIPLSIITMSIENNEIKIEAEDDQHHNHSIRQYLYKTRSRKTKKNRIEEERRNLSRVTVIFSVSELKIKVYYKIKILDTSVRSI